MIPMAPCIIDFIGANALLGPVGGGGGPGHSWALKWHRAKRVPFGPRSAQGPLPPTGPSNAFAPMKSTMHRAIRISGQLVVLCKCK